MTGKRQPLPHHRRSFFERLEDRHLLNIDLVSVSLTGLAGNNGSQSACISGDGRYVVFLSEAANLHPADTTTLTDIYRVRNPLAPPEIAISSAAIAENQAIGTPVGTLGIDGAQGSFAYSLVAGDGDADNGAFEIVGNELCTSAVLDFETRSSCSIRVAATDGASVHTEQVLVIRVTDLAECATPGLYDPENSVFYLRNANTTGAADQTFGYGVPGARWTELVGDWDGDGADTIGLFAPADSIFMLRDTLTTGPPDLTFGYGAPDAGWHALTGCWATQPEPPSAKAVDQLDLAELVAEELNGVA